MDSNGLYWIALDSIKAAWKSRVYLIDIENPHYLNADDDCCQKVTLQTRWWLVLNSISRVGWTMWSTFWYWLGLTWSSLQSASSLMSSQSSFWSHRFTMGRQRPESQVNSCSANDNIAFYIAKDYLSKQWEWVLYRRMHFDLVFSKSEDQQDTRWFLPQLLNQRTWQMKRLRRLEVNLFYLWHSRTHLARSHRIIHPDGPTNCRLPLCRSSFREYIWSIQTDGGRPRSKNWGALSTWRKELKCCWSDTWQSVGYFSLQSMSKALSLAFSCGKPEQFSAFWRKQDHQRWGYSTVERFKKKLNEDKRKEQRNNYILIWGGSSCVSIFFTSAFAPSALRPCECRICRCYEGFGLLLTLY